MSSKITRQATTSLEKQFLDRFNSLCRTSGARSPNAKSIGAFDKLGNLIHSFGALSEAARFLCGKDDNYRHKQTSIYKAANGIRKTYKGFVWKYI